MQNTYDLALDLKNRDASRLFRHLEDAEKLLRLHPHWHVETVNKGDERGGVQARVKDHATGEHLDIHFLLIFDQAGGMILDFKDGPLKQIQFCVKNDRLTAVISADIPEAEYDKQYHLGLWLRSIREYLRLFLTRTPYTFFSRFIMDHAILKMNPSQRKISMMILRYTFLEILLIIVIVIGYVLFMKP